MMKQNLLFLLALSVVSLTAAVPSFSYAHILDPQGQNIAAVVPDNYNQIGYPVVSPADYAVTEYYNPTGLDIWDYVPGPLAVVKGAFKHVWAVAKWIITKGSFIALGVAIVLGFCGLSHACTISFDKYPALDHSYRSLMESNALNTIEDYVYKAIDRFKKLQNQP